ncbi:MAG TPA: NAD(P)/FAD-dependent oxidoreductase [Bryobacteraceae bacterium]|nr:NAD(P)/FAD-dependent oxidoreductase [Bryobacteraceae bacterium]
MENLSGRVLIVGAGAAGLACARELTKAGRDLLVLEARDRIGGRICTIRDPRMPVPVELGAEFVHGVHPALWNVLREMAAPVVEVDGEHLTRDKHGLHESDSWERMGEIFDAMSRVAEQSFASFIHRISAPDDVRHAATGFVEGFNAARKEDVSVEWLNRENRASEEIDGDRAFRVLRGYDSVTAFLGEGLNIRLSTPVRRVTWKRGEATVETSDGDLSARHVVIAVPFALLASGALVIDPAPAALASASSAVATGNALRITYRFRDAIWEKHRRLSFLHGDEAFPVWWTPYPVLAPVITGWAAGPKADAMRGRESEELRDIGLRSLRSLLGEDPGEPDAFFVHDWAEDPWARGAYSYVRVNGMKAQMALAEPVEDTLWFTGEACAPAGHIGTVHGAIASGIAVAQRISGNKRWKGPPGRRAGELSS